MPSTCFAPIKARVARIYRLDVCGNPVTGAGAMVTFDGFVQIQASPEYEEGEEFLLKNANGGLCVNDKDANELKRVGLSVEFCTIDPDAIVLMTGERLLTTGGPATGTGVAFGEGLLTARFSLEVWQPISGAQNCSVGGTQQFVYWAFPNVGNAMIGDFTFENGTFTLTVDAETKRTGPLWGRGPTGVAPFYLPTAMDPTEHFAFNVAAIPPPLPTCGAV